MMVWALAGWMYLTVFAFFWSNMDEMDWFDWASTLLWPLALPFYMLLEWLVETKVWKALVHRISLWRSN